MPSFQTKALMVRPVGGYNFGIIPTVWLVWQTCLSDIYMSAVFVRDGTNRVGPLLPRYYTILRFKENMLQCLKTFFWATLTLWLAKIIFIGFVMPQMCETIPKPTFDTLSTKMLREVTGLQQLRTKLFG